jgi:hypothetical protein
MSMAPFYTRYRDLAFREMRALLVRSHESLPPGDYGFLEFYCNESGCDCRRVILHVLRADTGPRVWASINFGWEKPSYYRQWMRGDAEAARDLAGATLDPLNPQTEHSQTLLGLFQRIVLGDPAYVRRLERHYRLFKRRERRRSRARAPRATRT